MEPRKLTRSEVAQLGGLARARNLTPERREQIARMGGDAFMERHGREGIVRLGHMRHGRLTPTQKPAEDTTGSTHSQGAI